MLVGYDNQFREVLNNQFLHRRVCADHLANIEQFQLLIPIVGDIDFSQLSACHLRRLLAGANRFDTRITTFIVAETLSCTDGLVEILGALFKTDMADHWQVDETFFDLFRDKQAINAMLRKIEGEHVASGNITATAKVQKQIIKDCLNGTRTSQQADWRPHYMSFPMQAYTDKGGIEAMDSWKKVEKLFA